MTRKTKQKTTTKEVRDGRHRGGWGAGSNGGGPREKSGRIGVRVGGWCGGGSWLDLSVRQRGTGEVQVRRARRERRPPAGPGDLRRFCGSLAQHDEPVRRSSPRGA